MLPKARSRNFQAAPDSGAQGEAIHDKDADLRQSAFAEPIKAEDPPGGSGGGQGQQQSGIGPARNRPMNSRGAKRRRSHSKQEARQPARETLVQHDRQLPSQEEVFANRSDSGTRRPQHYEPYKNSRPLKKSDGDSYQEIHPKNDDARRQRHELRSQDQNSHQRRESASQNPAPSQTVSAPSLPNVIGAYMRNLIVKPKVSSDATQEELDSMY